MSETHCGIHGIRLFDMWSSPASSHLVCIACIRDERGRWEEAYRLLATETIYEGNSTYHWWAKATAYSGVVAEVCNAFRKLGFRGEFSDLPTLAARLSEFAEQIKSGSRSDET